MELLILPIVSLFFLINKCCEVGNMQPELKPAVEVGVESVWELTHVCALP